MSEVSLTIIKDNQVYQSDLKGLRPLMKALKQGTLLKDSYVIDKVVGKASALLLIYGQVKKVHGTIMSQQADELLTQQAIEHSYDQLIPYVLNQDHSDHCPMEKLVNEIDDAKQAYQLLTNIIK